MNVGGASHEQSIQNRKQHRNNKSGFPGVRCILTAKARAAGRRALHARARSAGPGGAGGIPAARGGKWSAVRVQRLLEAAGRRLFETQVAILIATRADQPMCLLEYTLKSWAAGRALTKKMPPSLLAVRPLTRRQPFRPHRYADQFKERSNT